MISVISLVLTLLYSTLEAAKIGGAATEVIAAIQAAITSLEKVRGTDVTFAQLEGLRVEPKW